MFDYKNQDYGNGLNSKISKGPLSITLAILLQADTSLQCMSKVQVWPPHWLDISMQFRLAIPMGFTYWWWIGMAQC